MSQSHGNPETAREHLVREVLTMPAGSTVADVLAELPRCRCAVVDPVCLLGEEGRLLGLVSLADLLAHTAGTWLDDIMEPAHAVPPDLDQEKVVAAARAHGLSAVPVVDAGGRLLGVVPPRRMLEVLHGEHVEDMHRLAGILHRTESAREAIESSPFRRVALRMPWLLVGLAGSMAAAAVMSRFEAVLQANVAVAFFVPAIVYLADAIGTQTEAVAVRGLSVSHRPLGRLLAGELATGVLIGLGLGILALPAVYFGTGDLPLAVAVAAAIFSAGSAASLVGLVFPWLLSRAGWDPAYGSGPVATIVQDILSLLVYFAAVLLIV